MKENTTTSLREAFEKARKDIIDSILKYTIWNKPSLGPVMFYLNDSTTGCIHNWSKVTLDELKLSWILRKITRSVLDLLIDAEIMIKEYIEQQCISFDRNTIDNLYQENIKKFKTQYRYEGDDISLKFIKNFSDIKKKMKLIINKSYVFDFIIKREELSKHIKLVNKIFEDLEPVFNLIESFPENTLQKFNIYLSLDGISLDKIIKTVKNLTKIVNYRVNALDKIIEIIKETCKDCIQKNSCNTCHHIFRYILKHPFLIDNDDEKENVKEKWKQLLERICKNKIDEELYKIIIYIFNYLPQETESSNLFKQLINNNQKQYTYRQDINHIKLRDLVYFEPLSYKDKNIKEWPLYKYTHYFERLFYGFEQDIKIENGFFVPIKFFESQVKGQIVIIHPTNIPFNECITAVERHYHSIKLAAKLDFYIYLMKNIKSNGKKFSTILCEALPKLFLLEGLISFEEDSFLVAHHITDERIEIYKKENNINTGKKHTNLKYFGGYETEFYKQNKNDITKLKEELNKKKRWEKESTDGWSYEILDLENSNNLNEVYWFGNLKQENIRSCFIMRFYLTQHKYVYIILFFSESSDIINISADDMIDTIFQGFNFQIAYEYCEESRNIQIIHKDYHHIRRIIDRKLDEMEDIVEKYEENKYSNNHEKILEKIINFIKKTHYTLESDLDMIFSSHFGYKENADLIKLVNNIIENIQYIAEQNNIEINIKNCSKEVIVFTNQFLFSRIIQNLLDNSITALINNTDSKRNIFIRIEKEKQLKVSIKDNAGGIPENVKNSLWQEKIFLENKGKGKGLFVVKQMIEKIDCSIEYKDIDNGTEFIIIFKENLKS